MQIDPEPDARGAHVSEPGSAPPATVLAHATTDALTKVTRGLPPELASGRVKTWEAAQWVSRLRPSATSADAHLSSPRRPQRRREDHLHQRLPARARGGLPVRQSGRGRARPPFSFVILRQAASSRRRPGDPAARESANLRRTPPLPISCLNRSPSAPLGPPVSAALRRRMTKERDLLDRGPR